MERNVLMKKKMIALLTALAMCFSLLTACGSGGAASEQAAGSAATAASSAAVSEEAAASSAAVSEEAAASSTSAEEALETASSAPVEADELAADANAPVEGLVEAPAIDPNAPETKVGMLTILNLSEEDAAQMIRARKLATVQLVKEGAFAQDAEMADENGPISVTYYDNLDTMLMALKSGKLTSISITDTVADYLVRTNPDLVKPLRHDEAVPNSVFADQMETGLVGEGYSFMLSKENKKLCKELDKVLTDMKEDGTLDRLIQEQITDVLNGAELREIKQTPIDGAKTIKVAVTGALPPMDYVSPVGMPVGFSTAVLAEIGARLHRNISVRVIDSGARASALASGKADVVFWTRTSVAAGEVEAMSEEQRYALGDQLTGDERNVIGQINSIYDFTVNANMDTPEGTIVTQPYYYGFNLPVLNK